MVTKDVTSQFPQISQDYLHLPGTVGRWLTNIYGQNHLIWLHPTALFQLEILFTTELGLPHVE